MQAMGVGAGNASHYSAIDLRCHYSATDLGLPWVDGGDSSVAMADDECGAVGFRIFPCHAWPAVLG